jgi:protein-tyrosine phosphatase
MKMYEAVGCFGASLSPMSPTTYEPEVQEGGAPRQSCSVLLVCTGNVCRSPAAEKLLAAAFAGTGIVVSSAGTHALVGEPISPPMAALLEHEGVGGSPFAARQLTTDMVRQADVVLGMAREHRAASVMLSPSAVQVAFTLRELARLLAQVEMKELASLVGPEAPPSRRLSALVSLARRRRAPAPEGVDDVVDPYRQSAERYAASFAQIHDAVRPLVRLTVG